MQKRLSAKNNGNVHGDQFPFSDVSLEECRGITKAGTRSVKAPRIKSNRRFCNCSKTQSTTLQTNFIYSDASNRPSFLQLSRHRGIRIYYSIPYIVYLPGAYYYKPLIFTGLLRIRDSRKKVAQVFACANFLRIKHTL